MVRLILVSLAFFALAVALRAAPDRSDKTAADKSQPPPAWDVVLTATNGELGQNVVKIHIRVKDGDVNGTHTRTSAKGAVTKTQVAIPAAAAAQLWKTMEKVNAMDLPDSDKPARDALDYTIGLAWSGKSRTIQVKGRCGDRYLQLLLAIEQCFDKGTTK